jgi:hypothetical protein
VDTEEFFIHEGRQREGTERVHACFVDAFGILSCLVTKSRTANQYAPTAREGGTDTLT